MYAELPEGWTGVLLRELASSRKGKKPLHFSPAPREGYTPYIDIKAFESGRIWRYADQSSSTLASRNSILVVWDGARCGLVGNAPCDGALGSTLAVLEPTHVSPEYIFHFLRSRYEQINSNPRGTGIPHVEPDLFWGLEVPLPPLAEQKRIVAKVENLLARVNAARDRLAPVPAILKRFRQSVLAAACSGRLTADWRDSRESLGDHPPVPVGAEIETGGLMEIPSTWQWMRLGDVASVDRGRFSIRPRNDPKYYGGAYPFVQIGDLPSEGGSIETFNQTLNEEGLSVSRLFPKGTVLIAIVGATIGNTGVLEFDSCCPDSLVAIRTASPSYSRFIEFYLRLMKLRIRDASYASGGQPNINLQTLRPFLVPSLPMEESVEIVRRVNILFTLAGTIEKRITTNLGQAEMLAQAILAKAFRGELVPTEADLAAKEGRDYETASVLLARIQEARYQHKPAWQGRGGKHMGKRSTGRESAKSRRPLDEVLREQGKPLTPERLFDLAGFDEDSVDGFYEQLGKLVRVGKVRENRPNRKDVYLECVGI